MAETSYRTHFGWEELNLCKAETSTMNDGSNNQWPARKLTINKNEK